MQKLENWEFFQVLTPKNLKVAVTTRGLMKAIIDDQDPLTMVAKKNALLLQLRKLD